MMDPQDELYDRRLATHLVSLYHKRERKTATTGDGMEVDQDEDDEEKELIDMAVLRDYIAYAREYIKPVINEEAANTLIKAYVEMRQAGSGRGQITAYPRQLESLIRLAEAHAKMRFSKKKYIYIYIYIYMYFQCSIFVILIYQHYFLRLLITTIVIVRLLYFGGRKFRF